MRKEESIFKKIVVKYKRQLNDIGLYYRNFIYTAIGLRVLGTVKEQGTLFTSKVINILIFFFCANSC